MTAVVSAGLYLDAPRSTAAPSPTNTTLTVSKGGDRIGPQTVSGLGNATFDFYAGVAGAPPASGAIPLTSCTTTAPAGTCSVDVPGRAGTDQGYWIVERTAPPGFTAPPQLATGGAVTTPTDYNSLFTGPVSNNVAYSFPQAGTGNANPTARGSVWADVRNNPVLPDHCGLNIALLIDVSGSIGPSLPDVKAAADGFVDALTGTPSHISLYSFAAQGTTLLGPTAVSTAANADTVRAKIDALTAGGGTNWDAGLFQIAAASSTYDAVIMLTDGEPTYYGPNAAGPGDFTRFREVENGIFSANALKALGTKVVAVGVGAGISGTPINLQAISGPVVGTDYVQTGYPALGAVFRSIALKSCSGTVNVVKKVIQPNGTPDTALPAGGWTFSTATPNVTPPSSQTAGDSGAVSFQADLSGSTTLPVTVTETQQPGFTLEQVAGANATCTSDGSPVTATNSGTDGFTVDALANAIVTCTVYNRAPIPSASVRVVKNWTINGTDYADPAQPTAFESALSLTGQTAPTWGQLFSGYSEGDSVTVGEQVDLTLLPPGCTDAASGDLGAHTLVAGLNVFRVANVVTCTTGLKLFKQVINPYGPPTASPDTWTLSALPVGSATPVVTGTTGISGIIAPQVTYALAETSVPGYAQEQSAFSNPVSGSTGSWHCALRTRSGTLGPEFDGLNGGVTVELGRNAECTAKNTAQPAKLTLKKSVDNSNGGTAVPTDWVLSATPSIVDEQTPVVSGHSGEVAVTGATAVPRIAYQLAESDGPSTGYHQLGGPACVLTGTTTAVSTPNGVLTPDLGQDITCMFTNVDQAMPPVTTPSTSPPPTTTPPTVPPTSVPPTTVPTKPAPKPTAPHPLAMTGVHLVEYGFGMVLALGAGVVLVTVAGRTRRGRHS
ncbi:hypothetical protein GCM10009839_34800 [Catenulispora yoronensis]|uniref:VWFA domain-containing protein n=1 Tax=Catenulispora yoronensis TaxID=450799 RepID=A0ABP5FUB5_9ACTN